MPLVVRSVVCWLQVCAYPCANCGHCDTLNRLSDFERFSASLLLGGHHIDPALGAHSRRPFKARWHSTHSTRMPHASRFDIGKSSTARWLQCSSGRCPVGRCQQLPWRDVRVSFRLPLRRVLFMQSLVGTKVRKMQLLPRHVRSCTKFFAGLRVLSLHVSVCAEQKSVGTCLIAWTNPIDVSSYVPCSCKQRGTRQHCKPESDTASQRATCFPQS